MVLLQQSTWRDFRPSVRVSVIFIQLQAARVDYHMAAAGFLCMIVSPYLFGNSSKSPVMPCRHSGLPVLPRPEVPEKEDAPRKGQKKVSTFSLFAFCRTKSSLVSRKKVSTAVVAFSFRKVSSASVSIRTPFHLPSALPCSWGP